MSTCIKITFMKPNPQGKGSLTILKDLDGSTQGLSIIPKNPEQVLTELFTSLFVLKATFKFKPIVGKDYWLYEVEGILKLYQFSPQEWGSRAPGQWIGKCSMGPDLIWSLEINQTLKDDPDFIKSIEDQRDQWEHGLEEVDSMETLLPEYAEELPYYQRVMAFGLSKSLKASLGLTGQLSLKPKDVIALRLEKETPKV